MLAAKHAAGMLGERGHVVVGHAGHDGFGHLVEDRVLHGAAALDQRDLLRALDRLEAVDELGGVDELRAVQAGLELRDESVRQAAGTDQSDGAVAALLEHIERAVGVIIVGVVHRQERRRADHLVDAAMHGSAPLSLRTVLKPPISINVIGSSAWKITVLG